MSERRRPLITANAVTLARLIPMPLLSWWIYRAAADGDLSSLWWALIVGTIIGCTDFVDGYLARKHGPTVLGGLLDPIADKVFIAFIYLPFADVGLIPAWAVALMFARELLVTALRSAYEQRKLSMKTSYFGKVKTWTQMQGIGVLLLIDLVSRDTMSVLITIGIVLPLLAMAGLYLVKKRFWPGALVMSGSFVALMAVHVYSGARGSAEITRYFIMLVIVAVTWASGFDYLISGLRHLRGRGDFGRSDAVRLLGAVTLPALIFAVLMMTPAPGWPLLAILSLELAVGGLDNLLSHHQKASGALPWSARVLGASALLAIALAVPAYATWLCVVAAAVSFAGVTWEFWRGRDYYLDRRKRDEALRDQSDRPVPTGSRP